MFRFGFHRKKKRPTSPQVPVLITAAPAKAHNLTPADEAIHIQLDQVLAWASDSQAQAYDVYFGTVTPPVDLVSEDQAAPLYVPNLALDTTYYWQVDAKNTIGTTAGDILSFSTWSADDILTDQDGNPVTDQNGYYVEAPSV